MPPKLRSKTILESQDSISDAEATPEGFVLSIVEQFKKNKADFLQEKFVGLQAEYPIWLEHKCSGI